MQSHLNALSALMKSSRHAKIVHLQVEKKMMEHVLSHVRLARTRARASPLMQSCLSTELSAHWSQQLDQISFCEHLREMERSAEQDKKSQFGGTACF